MPEHCKPCEGYENTFYIQTKDEKTGNNLIQPKIESKSNLNSSRSSGKSPKASPRSNNKTPEKINQPNIDKALNYLNKKQFGPKKVDKKDTDKTLDDIKKPAGLKMPDLGIDSWIKEPEGGFTHTFILLHGFTSQGNHFQGQKSQIPKTARVVCPSAPFRKVAGMTGIFKTLCDVHQKGKKEVHCWFEMENYAKHSKEQVHRIHKIIDYEVQLLKGDSTKLFIGGHSQGCDLTMFAGRTYPKPLGGLICLQNFPWHQPPEPKTDANKNVKVLVILGKKDDVCRFNDVKMRMNGPNWQCDKNKNVHCETWPNLEHNYDDKVFIRFNDQAQLQI